MDAWISMVEALDLDPVTASLLAAMVLVRLLLNYTGGPRPKPKRSRRGFVAWLDAGIVVVAVTFLVIRPFIVQLVDVRTGSMKPTLTGSLTPQIDGPNDKLVVVKYLSRLRAPRRGEMVVYDTSDNDLIAPEVGRVIAFGGEEIEITRDGVVKIDGRTLPEPYLEVPRPHALPAQTVPPSTWLVLGDNGHENPFGAWWASSPLVPETNLRGRAIAICWPPDRMRLLP